MRLKWIICKVLQKEAYRVAAGSPNIIDIVLMPQGLHNTPDILRTEIQKELNTITDVQGNPYDAILLGYGMCGNGIVGIRASIKTVMPRAHDCITLLLGSGSLYQQYLDTHRGVYWYSDGWIATKTMPGKDRYELLLAEYKEKYGEDNAKYLLEIEQKWMKEYNWAVYIDWNLPENETQKQYTRQCAEFLGWNYDHVKGDLSLMQNMADGKWDEKEFLILHPGNVVAEDLTNPGMIKAI